jgi:ubiquinone biosynthesis protein UbiJ
MLNPAISAINHLLTSESWAREGLAKHAGKSARLSLPPLDLDIRVLPDGTLCGTEEIPDTRIRMTPSALFRTMNGEMAEIDMTGDIEFAKSLGFLFRNLKWDAEEDLSRFTGDVLAHRIATAATSLLSWQKEAALRLFGNFAEYWTEEQPILARKDDISRHLHEVDETRDDIERLEKRISKLEGRT